MLSPPDEKVLAARVDTVDRRLLTIGAIHQQDEHGTGQRVSLLTQWV